MSKDIQALRAFAVLAVFAYHIRPEWITGGFARVDVFFVVSGFLISSHLLRELKETGTIKLANFWSRRAKRLLSASFAALGYTPLAGNCQLARCGSNNPTVETNPALTPAGSTLKDCLSGSFQVRWLVPSA